MSEIRRWRIGRTVFEPVDIALKHGHGHLVPLFEPRLARQVEKRALERIQAHFHDTIRGRIGRLKGMIEELRLPELAPTTEYSEASFSFLIPGMQGGFEYQLVADGAAPKLLSHSSSRFVTGSGESHEATPEGSRLVGTYE